MSKEFKVDHQIKLPLWSGSLIKIRELGKLLPLQVLVINEPGVTSYMHESEFPSQTHLLP
jgi:hypothetical protein